MGPIYLPVKSLQSVSNTNLFSSDSRCTNTFKKPYLLKLKKNYPPTGVLSVKAQRVSALRGGSAKYI